MEAQGSKVSRREGKGGLVRAPKVAPYTHQSPDPLSRHLVAESLEGTQR